jgi:hypothetical protein
MSLRYRPMGLKDVDECVRIVAEHPVLGPRYARAIVDLRPAWLRLLDCRAKSAVVFEEVERTRVTRCGFGISVFVVDDFLCEVKTPPLFWWGPELARRMVHGRSPLLSDEELAEANSSGGMNLLSWEACVHPEFEDRTDVYREVIGAFIEQHRGFLWKELVSCQSQSPEEFQMALDAGGSFLWDAAKGCYVKLGERKTEELVKAPHLLGVTRELGLSTPGSWVCTLFDYQRPQLKLSQGEQRLLLTALSGVTDERLAQKLEVSLNTVRNTWRSIYGRAVPYLPELFADDSPPDARNFQRGKEKKRHLLAYLRKHPEELRPVSKKLLHPSTLKPGPFNRH